MASITPKAYLKKAVTRRANSVDPADVKISDRVLIFPDEPGRRLGPFRVVDVDG